VATESYLKRRDAGWHAKVAATQAAWQTPVAVLAGAVRRATGAGLVRHERVLAGLTNEVYAATAAGGQAVVVRISHAPGRNSSRSGGPSGAAGRRACRCRRSWPSSTACRCRGRPARSASRVAELGRVPARAAGGPATRERAERVRRASPDGARVADATAAATGVLRARRGLLGARPARLVHHDYEPWHLFADPAPGAARLTGGIDLESCRGGDSAYDLAQWHVVHDAYAPVAPVVAGYRAAGGWTDGFDARLRLSLVHYRLRGLLERLGGDTDGDRPVAVDGDALRGAQLLAAAVAEAHA
jgi:hypothetical protein